MDFTQIALLLVVAALFGVAVKYLKQPPFIGYLFAGATLAYLGLIHNLTAVDSLAKVGITLLLFLVGLEMDLKELPTIGKTSILVGLGQIFVTFVLGFLLSMILGLSSITSFYIAIALTFSSTIVVVKLLSERRDLNSLYGKITVGILLIQDLVAILVLVFLSGLGGGVDPLKIVLTFVKVIVLFILVWISSKKILPLIFGKFVAGSPEMLFVGSIAWALGFAALASGPLGLTPEIGGFLAGLSLSNLPEHFGISSKTKPLRDFFLTIFFLTLGMQIVIGNISHIILPAIIFSLFVLIIHTLVTILLMGILRYKKRTSFLTAVSLAQISEFSFIIMAAGLRLGVVNVNLVSIIVLVGVITMTASSYLISSGGIIYTKVKDYLKIFERKDFREEILLGENDFDNHVILIGCGRIGKTLLSFFKKSQTSLLVIDYNPKVFARLTSDKIPSLLGDIEDLEVLELAKIEKSRIVISTIANLNDDLALLAHIKSLRSRPMVIVKAASREEAVKLYESGATYVLLPEVVAGEYLRHIFSSHGLGESRLTKMGKNHFSRLINYA